MVVFLNMAVLYATEPLSLMLMQHLSPPFVGKCGYSCALSLGTAPHMYLDTLLQD